MTEEKLKILRDQEDEQLIRHLQAMQEIIATKCARCKSIYGCMGCVFDSIDGRCLGGLLKQSMKMMETQNLRFFTVWRTKRHFIAPFVHF